MTGIEGPESGSKVEGEAPKYLHGTSRHLDAISFDEWTGDLQSTVRFVGALRGQEFAEALERAVDAQPEAIRNLCTGGEKLFQFVSATGEPFPNREDPVAFLTIASESLLEADPHAYELLLTHILIPHAATPHLVRSNPKLDKMIERKENFLGCCEAVAYLGDMVRLQALEAKGEEGSRLNTISAFGRLEERIGRAETTLATMFSESLTLTRIHDRREFLYANLADLDIPKYEFLANHDSRADAAHLSMKLMGESWANVGDWSIRTVQDAFTEELGGRSSRPDVLAALLSMKRYSEKSDEVGFGDGPLPKSVEEWASHTQNGAIEALESLDPYPSDVELESIHDAMDRLLAKGNRFLANEFNYELYAYEEILGDELVRLNSDVNQLEFVAKNFPRLDGMTPAGSLIRKLEEIEIFLDQTPQILRELEELAKESKGPSSQEAQDKVKSFRDRVEAAFHERFENGGRSAGFQSQDEGALSNYLAEIRSLKEGPNLRQGVREILQRNKNKIATVGVDTQHEDLSPPDLKMWASYLPKKGHIDTILGFSDEEIARIVDLMDLAAPLHYLANRYQSPEGWEPHWPHWLDIYFEEMERFYGGSDISQNTSEFPLDTLLLITFPKQPDAIESALIQCLDLLLDEGSKMRELLSPTLTPDGALKVVENGEEKILEDVPPEIASEMIGAIRNLTGKCAELAMEEEFRRNYPKLADRAKKVALEFMQRS